jgi:hypothetical protein
MPIRDWSQRRIASLWLTWLLLVAIAFWRGREVRDAGLIASRHVPTHTLPRSVDIHNLSDSQAVLLYFALTPWLNGDHPDSTRQATLLALLSDSLTSNRDSAWNALQLPAKLTGQQRDSLPTLALAAIGRPFGDVAKGLADAGATLWLGLLGMLLLYAAPPLILGVITLRWYIPRVVARASAGRAV